MVMPEGEFTSFVSFLRLSYHRPRDIFTMLKILQVGLSSDVNREKFTISDFESSSFQREYSDYLLGKIKDQLSFYYKESDYQWFLKFFSGLNGHSRFTYGDYNKAFEKVKKELSDSLNEEPKFMSSSNEFLQFLYELNVIGSIEKTDLDRNVFRWCFRERTISNLSPKVRCGSRSL